MEKQHVYYINFIIFGLTRQRTKPVRFPYSNRANQKLFKQGVSFFGCFNCDLIQMNFKVTCSHLTFKNNHLHIVFGQNLNKIY